MNRRATYKIVVTILIIGLIALIGPMDYFAHGFYSDEINISGINDSKWENISLEKDISLTFSPGQDHFTGFEIYLTGKKEGDGILQITVSNQTGGMIEKKLLKLSEIKYSAWHRIYMEKGLVKNQIYTITFHVENTNSYPDMKKTAKEILPTEIIDGNVAVSFAYRQSTFRPSEKILLSLALISILLLIYAEFGKKAELRKLWRISIMLMMTVLLCWNYEYNTFDNQNGSFGGFQWDSEDLVTGMFTADQDNAIYENPDDAKYGLGRYLSREQLVGSYPAGYLTDQDWIRGYSRKELKIKISSNEFTRIASKPGNKIRFKSGTVRTITEIDQDESYITLSFESSGETTMLAYKEGGLDEITFLQPDNSEIPMRVVRPYRSQYGLQGKIMRMLAKRSTAFIQGFHFACAFLTAAVFVMIVWIIRRKYNLMMAICFYTVFGLSPWIVNFAKNLYWVEFTWFIPMLFGLLCTWKINQKAVRITSIAGAFISILIKCLCGYEYIPTIMMGLIAFPVFDLAQSILKKDWKIAKLRGRTIICLGMAALLGFVTAIVIHATLRGNGNITEGIQSIIEKDVLRRTYGADFNNFDPVYYASFNASGWEVVMSYFNFSTNIIAGITGNLFPLLCVIPVAILVYDKSRHRMKTEQAVMYVFFLLTSISWFYLAKSHSYIHHHMNYVMWYFGFVQICLYIIADKICECFRTVALTMSAQRKNEDIYQ